MEEQVEIETLSWEDQEAVEGHKSRWTAADSAKLLNDFVKDLAQGMSCHSRGEGRHLPHTAYGYFQRKDWEGGERKREGRKIKGCSKEYFFFFFNEPPGGRGHKRKEKAKSTCIYFISLFPPLLYSWNIASLFCASDGTLVVVLVNEAWNLLLENMVSMCTTTHSLPGRLVSRG